MLNALRLLNSVANVNIDGQGNVINAGETCVPNLDKVVIPLPDRPSIGAVDALAKLAEHLNVNLAKDKVVLVQVDEDHYKLKTDAFEDEVPAELNYFIDTDSETKMPQLTWHMVVKLPHNWYDAHVSAHSGTQLQFV